MEHNVSVRIPAVRDVREAYRIYLERYDLGTQDIMEIFGCSYSKAARLKKEAQAYQRDHGELLRTSAAVNTDAAFRSWGIDPAVLEARVKKLERLEKKGGGKNDKAG